MKSHAKLVGSLRSRAERMLTVSPAEIKKMTQEEVQRLIQELQVHQLELQLQTEELREAQIALTEERDRYSELYEFAPVAYATLDSQGKILKCNLMTSMMLGVDRGSLLQKKFTKFICRKSQDDWHRFWLGAFATKAKQTCKVGMRKPDGESLAVHLECIAAETTEGRTCLVTLVDATARRRAEEALDELTRTLEQRVQERTAQIEIQARGLANLAEAVLITAGNDWSDSLIVFVNDTACAMTGYVADELLGQPRITLLGSSNESETLQSIRKQLASGTLCKAELFTRRKDGSHYPAEVSISPLRDSAGRCTHFVSIHRDISERKEAEDQLSRYRQDLKTMASELLLAEERERKQLAQDLHDSIGQALFLLRRKLDQEPVGKAASAEIGVILGEIAKVVSTLTFELSPRILHELGLRPAIRGLSLEMKQRFGLLVTVDDDRRAIPLEERAAVVLFRSLREILINVAKHSETNSARVSIKKVDSTLQITVEDKGKGFDLTSLGQVDAGRFGLFSVRERLEYLGGSLRIQSRHGAGTSVTLTVPLAA